MAHFIRRHSDHVFASSTRHMAPMLALTLICLGTQPAIAGSCDGGALTANARQLSAEIKGLESQASAYQSTEGDPQSKQHLQLAARSMSTSAANIIGGDAGKALNRMNTVMQHYHLVAWRLGVATAWGKNAKYVQLWEKSEGALQRLLAYRKTLFSCYTKPYLS